MLLSDILANGKQTIAPVSTLIATGFFHSQILTTFFFSSFFLFPLISYLKFNFNLFYLFLIFLPLFFNFLPCRSLSILFLLHYRLFSSLFFSLLLTIFP